MGVREHCTEERRISRLELQMKDLVADVTQVRAMIVGPGPEETGGIRKDVSSVLALLDRLRNQNQTLKYILLVIVLLKTPDFLHVLVEFLKKGAL